MADDAGDDPPPQAPGNGAGGAQAAPAAAAVVADEALHEFSQPRLVGPLAKLPRCEMFRHAQKDCTLDCCKLNEQFGGEPVGAHWQRCILPCLHSHAGSAVRASAGSQGTACHALQLHGAAVAQLPEPAVLMGAHLPHRCIGCTSARWRGAWYAQRRQPCTSGRPIATTVPAGHIDLRSSEFYTSSSALPRI